MASPESLQGRDVVSGWDVNWQERCASNAVDVAKQHAIRWEAQLKMEKSTPPPASFSEQPTSFLARLKLRLHFSRLNS